MRKMKVGLQLFSVRNAMGKDFEGTLRAVRDMGYEYVEFAGYFGRSGEQIKKILDDLGLKCISVHQTLDFFDEEPEAKAAFLKTFGVKYNVVPWYPVEKLAGSPVWEETIANFRKYADFFASQGMMLGYHNHDFEFRKADGKYLHDHLFDSIDPEKIVPELDTCWIHYAGIRPEEKIRQFKGRVPIVHLKDFVCKKFGGGPVYDLIDTDGKPKKVDSEDNGFEFTPLGQGIQNFSAILEACDECGTEIVIVEQDTVYHGMTELEAAKISVDYLKNTFGL